MRCPVCNDVQLLIADRQGIEIDYCPQCRGVWLDRGELDKLIERSAIPAAHMAEGREAHVQQAPPAYHEKHHKPHDKHKRKSFLGELFDFD
ncbi:MAG: zf-TFIIB domain-containing protein [Myxococcota bacterium]|nr:zf-TFIIB domain-containing protein [Myxococcota bacterium]